MQTMEILLYVYAFIVGICVASFINVVVYRLPRSLNYVSGRSFCPRCKNTLKPYDMVPVLSWLWLRGRCRVCKQPIAVRYPLVECIGGVLAVLIFQRYGIQWDTLLVFLFAIVLLTIGLIDYDTMIIPNGCVFFCLICGILSIAIWPEINMFERIIGCFIIATPMVLINLVVADSFGGGDVKLMAACGFMLGWQTIVLAAFLGILLAGTYAIYLMVRKKIGKSDHIAFGPYLCIGILVATLYGADMIQMYLSVFGL